MTNEETLPKMFIDQVFLRPQDFLKNTTITSWESSKIHLVGRKYSLVGV
jgi:hypothetical protein